MKINWRFGLILGLLFLVLLRFLAVRGDFWIDEIWSFSNIVKLDSLDKIFTSIRIDNNHYLNSIILWILFKFNLLSLARIPALLASISLLFFIINSHSKDKIKLLLSLILMGLSFPLIHFGTEARGYTYLVFFAYLSLSKFQKETKTSRNYFLFHSFQIFGFLSHLSFASMALSMAICYFIRLMNKGQNIVRASLNTIRFEAPTLIFLIILYFIDLRHIKIGGGPNRAPLKFLGDLSDLYLSRELALAISLFLLTILLVLKSKEFFTQADSKTREKIFITFLVSLISPVFSYLVTKYYFLNNTPYPRYFLLGYFIFIYVLIDACKFHFMSPKPFSKTLVKAFLLVFAISNFWNYSIFLKYGRGQYSKAINYIVDNSPNDIINVGIKNNRDLRLFNFYSESLHPFNKIFNPSLIATPLIKVKGDDWYIEGQVFKGFEEKTELLIPGIGEFKLIKTFPSALFSGSTWMLYRKSYDNLQ